MDLFYYGSQDIPPRLGGGRDPRERNGNGSGDRVCEACSRPVDAEDLDSGRASEIYGVVLCANCGGGEGTHSEDRVELYFCDRCHVSVPVYRVDTGEALSGDGRILCLNCREKIQQSRLPRLAVVLSVLILLGVGGAFGLKELFRQPPAPGHEAALRSLDAKLSDLSRVLEQDGSSGEVDGIVAGIDDLEKAALERILGLENAKLSLDRLRAEFDRRMREIEVETGALHKQMDTLIQEAQPKR